MLTDLYLSKEEQLKNWMKSKGFFATHEVIEQGLRLYYNRANRSKQEFLKEGIIRMLSDDEKLFRGYNTKEAIYEWRG